MPVPSRPHFFPRRDKVSSLHLTQCSPYSVLFFVGVCGACLNGAGMPVYHPTKYYLTSF